MNARIEAMINAMANKRAYHGNNGIEIRWIESDQKYSLAFRNFFMTFNTYRLNEDTDCLCLYKNGAYVGYLD